MPWTLRLLCRARVGLTGAVLAVALAPAPAQARPGLETLVQDDATLLHRSTPEVSAAMARLRALGVDRVRLTADWSHLTREPEANRRPDFDAADPAAYEPPRWAALDRAVVAAHGAGLKVMVDVGFWAPVWAAREREGPRARTAVRPQAYADFVEATLQRYSGTFRPRTPVPGQDAAAPDPNANVRADGRPSEQQPPPLPEVDRFALWNEPNHPALLLPQWTSTRRSARPASPGVYRRMLSAAVPRARAVRPDAELLIGNTSSSGGTPGTGAVAPLRFLRELACVDRKLRPRTTPDCANYRPLDGDGWAHHPYNRNVRPDTPTPPSRPDDISVAQLGKLARTLDALAARGRIAPQVRRIFVTEFGYETEPIPRRPEITQTEQSRWLVWAERLAARHPTVAGWAQFLLRDQPPAATRVSDSTARPFGEFGTGLDRADGTPKLAARSFVAGLFADTLSPRRTALWVRLRLGDRARRVLVEERRDGRWRRVATRPRRGGRMVKSFVLGGQEATVRVVVRRPGVRYRLRTRTAAGRQLVGPAVGVAPPLPR